MKAVITLIALLITTSLSAQFDTTYTFYNSKPNKVDLHYDLGWTRSNNTVTLTNGKMITTKSQWFQTGPTKLTGSGYIENDYRTTNSSGKSRLKVELINTKTGNKVTKLDTVVTNSTKNTCNIYLDKADTNTYYIRYTYLNPGGNSNCKLEMTTLNIVPYVALPLIEIKHKRDTTSKPTYKDVKIYHGDNHIKLIIEESNEYELTIYTMSGKVICKESGVSNGVVNIPYESNQINVIVVNTLGKITSHKL